MFSMISRSALRSTQPRIQWLPGSIPGKSPGWGMKLITCLHLAPMLRMSGATCLLPPHAFMELTGTILPLPLLFLTTARNGVHWVIKLLWRNNYNDSPYLPLFLSVNSYASCYLYSQGYFKCLYCILSYCKHSAAVRECTFQNGCCCCLLLLYLLLPLCRVFTLIYLKQNMFLRYIVLQLFCIYNL